MELTELSSLELLRLCEGADCWHTRAVPGLGLHALRMADGPHGLRRQGRPGDMLGMKAPKRATWFPPPPATAVPANPLRGGEDPLRADPPLREQTDRGAPPQPTAPRRTGHRGHGGLIRQHRHAASLEPRKVSCRIGHADQHLRGCGRRQHPQKSHRQQDPPSHCRQERLPPNSMR